MKELMVAFCIIMCSSVSGSVLEKVIYQPLPVSEQELSREKIHPDDLPEVIKESLKAPDYAGWTVEEAYKARITDPTSPESEGLLIYIVEMRRQDETATLRFDEDGRRLDDDDEQE